MKKLSILTTMLLGVLLFTACDADRDDNPVIDLTKTQEPIKLNTPAFAGGTYDLESSDSVVLTCTAPNYGFPATVTYVVQLSIDADMTKPNELTTTFSNNRMVVAARELAIATTKQLMDKKSLKQDDFPQQTPVYIRIRAFIDGVQGSETMSNVVKLNEVKTRFALPDVTMPEHLYVNGKFTGNNWENAVPSNPVHSATDTHWRICWIDSEGVMTSPVKGEPNYADDYITISYSCKTAGFQVDANGKITADTPAWYLMIIDGTVDNDKRSMELKFSFEPAEVWLIGSSIVNAEAGITSDDCWSEKKLREDFTQYVKFETPTDMKGEFKSPALTSPVDGDGGTRAYVKVKAHDWWKSEFFVFNKQIVYRGAGGDQERVNGAVGQHVFLNFSDDSGYLKK